MKALAITLLSISNATIVWTVIGLFLVGAFIFRIVDGIKTVKNIEKSLAKRKSKTQSKEFPMEDSPKFAA